MLIDTHPVNIFRENGYNKVCMTYHFRHVLVNHKGATSGKAGSGKANRIGGDRRCVTLRIGLLPEAYYVRILPLPF